MRTESVRGQLAGTIPSTDAGQEADPSALIDASALTISDMGSMTGGEGGPKGVPFGAADPGQDFQPGEQEASSGGSEASSMGGGPAPGGEASSAGGEAGFSVDEPTAANPGAAPPSSPEGMDGFASNDKPDLPGTTPDTAASTSGAMLLLSAAVLLGGLFVSLIYKRRKCI